MLRLLHRPDEKRVLPQGRAPRLLVIQIAGIGDLVLATPVLDALRERFPAARIDLLTSPRAVDLLAHHPKVNSVYPFDIGQFRNPLKLLSPEVRNSFRDQVKPLRTNRYDALLSLNNISTRRGAWTLGLLMKVIGAPIWVGRNTDGRAPWFDRAVQEKSSDPVPEALTKLAVGAHLGASSSDRPLNLPLDDRSKEKAKSLLATISTPIAAILPGANVDAKQWPSDRFAQVAKQLAGRGYTVVTLGGPDDRAAAEKIDEALDGTLLRLEGSLTLPEVAAVLAKCDVAITNDTGPMHMAAAVGLPLVALFCSVNLQRYRPWMDDTRYCALTGDTDGHDPRSVEGMRASVLNVSVERVMGALDELGLDGRR
ncbi:glycosyltransferase family 9 protein [bacterium]|nr:glycosyltransferase family 9 protein [bacterium]